MSNIQIKFNYMHLSSATKLEYYLDKLTSPSNQPLINSALGLSPDQASKVSRECPILPLSDNEENNEISIMLTELILEIKEELEDFYNTKLELKNCVYNNMLEGSFIGFHADTAHLEDGQWVEEEEAPFEYSALFYFNDNYEGGELSFPTLGKDFVIKPKKNSLVYFKGDSNLPHQVNEITKGIRKNLVLFFGNPNAKGEYIHNFEEQ